MSICRGIQRKQVVALKAIYLRGPEHVLRRRDELDRWRLKRMKKLANFMKNMQNALAQNTS